MNSKNQIINMTLAALFLSGCGSGEQPIHSIGGLVEAQTATDKPGGASVSIVPMTATNQVMSVVLTVDDTSSYSMAYNGGNGNFYSTENIELPAGEHTVVARAYSESCTAETCVPGVNQVGEGSANVTIVSGQTANIYMRILDISPPDPDITNHAPVITVIVISETQTAINTSIELQSVAMDPDGAAATNALEYLWSTGSCTISDAAVTFGSPTERNTSWESSIAQDCTITLTVIDRSSNLYDSVSTPPVHVGASGLVLAPYSAWFIPRPAIMYILATDSNGNVCAYDSGFSAGTCDMNFEQAIDFAIYVDAGVDAPVLSEIEATIQVDDYCLGGGFELVEEVDMASSFWVSYHYVWTPGNTFNVPCAFDVTASHLGMTDTAFLTLRSERFVGYFSMRDIESANDLTLTAEYIPDNFRSVVGDGNLGTDDYYAVHVAAGGETMVFRTGEAFGAPGSGFDTRLELYDATSQALVLLAADDNSGPGELSQITYTFPVLETAHTYYVRISRADGSVGSNTDLYSLYFERFQ